MILTRCAHLFSLHVRSLTRSHRFDIQYFREKPNGEHLDHVNTFDHLPYFLSLLVSACTPCVSDLLSLTTVCSGFAKYDLGLK